MATESMTGEVAFGGDVSRLAALELGLLELQLADELHGDRAGGVHQLDLVDRVVERDAIGDFLAAAVIGGPQTVQAGLQRLIDLTQANELMLVCDIYDPTLRLRSLDIAADICVYTNRNITIETL